jgi:hypothetical protein
MTLTVRLKPELETALERHCAERGVSKSLVVQEVLAEYLARAVRRGKRSEPEQQMPAKPSANYLAFEAAGFIGAGALDSRPTDKARMREVMAERLAAKKLRRGAA